MKPTYIVLLFIAAFLLGMLSLSLLTDEKPSEMHDHAADSEKATVYTCSMHPQIRLPEMGQCPICFMDLIPVEERGEETDPSLLVMGEAAVQLAEIRTAPAVRADDRKSIRLQGRITYDETRISQISAWLPGRIDRKFVDFTGIEVHQGEHLVNIYSPQLIDAQENLLQALSALKRDQASELAIIRDTAKATYKDARDKLLLLGLKEEQVDQLERTRAIQDQITIYSPTSGIVIEKHIKQGAYVTTGSPLYTIADLAGVWLMADAYESELNWLRYGQEVTFEVRAFPGESFQGRISFISPTIDPASRTVKVRIKVDNPRLRLKPGMFATAQIEARLSEQGLVLDQNLTGVWICPMHRGVFSDHPGQCSICGMDLVSSQSLGLEDTPEAQAPLLIPRSAPLITGKRAVVYIRLPETEQPTFAFREVVLGPRVGEHYVVLSGLEEGDEVVYNGNFKIDATRQIKALPSMLSLAGEPRDAAKPEVSDTFKEHMGKLQEAYYRAQSELADDQMAGPAIEAFGAALTSMPLATLTDDERQSWLALAKPLTQSLETFTKAADIEAEREAFHHISEAFIKLIDTFGAELPAYQYHCPMGPGEGGSSWLQKQEDMFNPYMGKRMLKCGSFLGELRGSR